MFFYLNDLDNAASAYKSFYTNFADNQFVTSALLHRGEALFREHNIKDLDDIVGLLQKRRAEDRLAGIAYAELSRLLPGDTQASTLLTDRGFEFFKKGNYSAARAYFSRAVISHPNDAIGCWAIRKKLQPLTKN